MVKRNIVIIVEDIDNTHGCLFCISIELCTTEHLCLFACFRRYSIDILRVITSTFHLLQILSNSHLLSLNFIPEKTVR